MAIPSVVEILLTHGVSWTLDFERATYKTVFGTGVIQRLNGALSHQVVSWQYVASGRYDASPHPSRFLQKDSDLIEEKYQEYMDSVKEEFSLKEAIKKLANAPIEKTPATPPTPDWEFYLRESKHLSDKFSQPPCRTCGDNLFYCLCTPNKGFQ